MRYLLLIALSSCRAPDYLETSVFQEEGIIDGRADYDQEAQGAMFTLGWHFGQQAEAMKNLAALDISKAGALRTESYSAPVVVHEDHHEEPEERDNAGTIIASVATLLTLIGAGWWKTKNA